MHKQKVEISQVFRCRPHFRHNFLVIILVMTTYEDPFFNFALRPVFVLAVLPLQDATLPSSRASPRQVSITAQATYKGLAM